MRKYSSYVVITAAAVLISAVFFVFGRDSSFLRLLTNNANQDALNVSMPKYKIVFLGASPAIKTAFDGFKDKLNEIKEEDVRTEYIDLNISYSKKNIEEAADFILQKNADLIVTGQTEIPILAAKIKNIPIISVLSNDPVGQGLARSNEGSGNNVVFFETGNLENSWRRISYFLELAPYTKTILVIRDINSPGNEGMKKILEEAAKNKISIIDKQFGTREELNQFILSYDFRNIDAVLRYPGTFIASNIDLFFILESKIKKPIIVLNRSELESGGILLYGPRNQEFGRAGAVMAWQLMVNKVDPATVPIQKPFRYELGINEKVAESYGIKIPESLREKADYIIQ